MNLQQRLPMMNKPDIAPYTEELRASLQHRMSGSGKVQATRDQSSGEMSPAPTAPPPQGSSSMLKRRHRLEAPPNLPSAWDVLGVRRHLHSEVIRFGRTCLGQTRRLLISNDLALAIYKC